MSDAIFTAAVAAATSLVVAVIGPWAARSYENARERRVLISSVNLQHLAPLRQQLAEAAFRHRRVLDDFRAGGRSLLGGVDHVRDVHAKPLDWFAGEGCFLMSTCYYTARLFAEIVRLGDAYPYLRLNDKRKEAELTALVLRVRLAFAGEGGVWFAIQAAIGEDMIGADGRLAGYPDFCHAVQDEHRGVWYRQLIGLYRALADGQGVDRIGRTLAAMEHLSHLLDAAVGSSASVSDRLRLEDEEQASRKG